MTKMSFWAAELCKKHDKNKGKQILFYKFVKLITENQKIDKIVKICKKNFFTYFFIKKIQIYKKQRQINEKIDKISQKQQKSKNFFAGKKRLIKINKNFYLTKREKR